MADLPTEKQLARLRQTIAECGARVGAFEEISQGITPDGRQMVVIRRLSDGVESEGCGLFPGDPIEMARIDAIWKLEEHDDLRDGPAWQRALGGLGAVDVVRGEESIEGLLSTIEGWPGGGRIVVVMDDRLRGGDMVKIRGRIGACGVAIADDPWPFQFVSYKDGEATFTVNE